MRTLIGAMLLLGGSMLGAGEAQAQQCGGNLIAVKGIHWGDGARVGELQLYYNPANGRNCAITMHGGVTWGRPTYTDVHIETCSRAVFNANGGTCPPGSPSDYWQGNVGYYTSPVSIPGAGRCVDAMGAVARHQNSNVVSAVRIAGHCGG